MQTTTTKLPKRIEYAVMKSEGVLAYDRRNDYPQRIMDYMRSSGVARSCVRLLARYLNGDGFADPVLWKARLSQTTTGDKLLRRIAQDRAMFDGFALHVNFNALYQVVSIDWIPFEMIRLVAPKDEARVTQVGVHRDWTQQRSERKGGRIKPEEIEVIDLWDPRPEMIQAQVDQAGGWNNYRGQVYYAVNSPGEYPLSPMDPVLLDVETDHFVGVFKNKNIRTNWVGSHILVHKGRFEDDSEREEFIQDIEQFQGADGAGNILVVDVDDKEEIPEIVTFPVADQDKLYQYTEASTVERIIRCFGQPSILHSINSAGKLGTSEEFKIAVRFYNDYTRDDRRAISEALQEIASRMDRPICPSGDFSILPLKGIQTTGENISAVFDRLGPEQVVKVTEILTGTLPDERKRSILEVIYGLTKKEVDSLLSSTPTV